MTTFLRFTLHVVFPTALGTCVYVGWRTPDLLVFHWIDYCGLNSFVYRPTVALPEWVLFTLPDGCWVYATTSWMLLIWQRLVPWAWLGVILAVGGEIGQFFGYVQGTYQTLDIVFYIGAFIIAGAINAKTPIVYRRHISNDIPGAR